MDYLQKSTRSSGATRIGCTFGAPNEIRVLKNQNADLQSINSRQNTESWRVIIEEDSKRLLLLDHSEFRSNDPTDLLSNHPLSKLKNCKLDLRSLGRLFQNQHKDRGLVGDRYPPGPPEGQDASRRACGPNNPQGHPFVGLGRNDQ